jgi:hypothetical protein
MGVFLVCSLLLRSQSPLTLRGEKEGPSNNCSKTNPISKCRKKNGNLNYIPKGKKRKKAKILI